MPKKERKPRGLKNPKHKASRVYRITPYPRVLFRTAHGIKVRGRMEDSRGRPWSFGNGVDDDEVIGTYMVVRRTRGG